MSADPIVERNKETFRLLQHEIIAKGRLELVEQVFSPTFHATRAGLAGLTKVAGRPPYPAAGSAYEQIVQSNAQERFITGYRAMTATLADQERIIEELNGEGNVLWARWRIRATHAAELLRVPATGKRVDYIEVGVLRFDDDGRLAEGWFLADEVDLALQLGIAIG
jgi:predicted ester cyclase